MDQVDDCPMTRDPCRTCAKISGLRELGMERNIFSCFCLIRMRVKQLRNVQIGSMGMDVNSGLTRNRN